jgi:hypothetical protein
MVHPVSVLRVLGGWRMYCTIDGVGIVQWFKPWDSWTLPMGVLTISIWIQEMW